MDNYLELYNSKMVSPAEIAGRIHSGMKIMSDIANAQPLAICTALNEKLASKEVRDLEINTILELYPLPWYKNEEICRNNRFITWFSGNHMRKLVNKGLADINPGTYWDFPAAIREEKEFDCCILAVSSMDRYGYFSTGLTASITPAVIEKSKYLFLEINENMPYLPTGPLIHISDVDALCVNTVPLSELPPVPSDEISDRIGQYIADEIPDGATLQLGIGAIPNAVGNALREKHNLGIHTEMLTDSMIDLIECGAVNNSLKPLHRGKTVATFAMGSQKMYDFIDHNPSIEILPVDYVNNPYIIGQHPDFISVNAALEVDFFGQVCAESIGLRHFSGSGGQSDYVRGAQLSRGGKSFIAFPSTAKNDTISKINPTLSTGSLVTTSKNDVDMIVTEYGIAKLRGRTLAERTRALIQIAHPKYREKLTFEAKKMNILI